MKEEFVLLVFGFINGYKGIDWIINMLSTVKNRNIKLLIAGGENPYLKDKPFYQEFYKKIILEISKHHHISHTGFIPDEDIHLYFSASDLVVLPYEVFMSASGPFSHVLSYQKPVIISEKLADYSKSADFNMSLKQSKLEKKDIIFNLERKDLLRLVSSAQRNIATIQKLEKFSQLLSEKRSMSVIVNRLDEILAPVRSEVLTIPRLARASIT